MSSESAEHVEGETLENIISKLRELQPCDGGEYIAVLEGGKALSCSRGYKPQVQALIERISKER